MSRLEKRHYRPYPGRFNRDSGERIVGKFFIAPTGEILEVLDTHQQVAFHVLKDRGAEMEPTVQNMIAAEDALKAEGYIRGQLYEHSGLGLEGTSAALKARAHTALKVLPYPRRVVMQLYPQGTAKEYLKGDLGSLGWGRRASGRRS